MAKNFNSSALPEHCYAVLPGSGQLIEVRRGKKGYYPCAYSTSDREYNKVLANYFNAHEGISKAQAAAMLAGSMFGWNVLLPILPVTMQRASRSNREKRKRPPDRRNISTSRQSSSGRTTSPEPRLCWMKRWKIPTVKCLRD
jgi:hypothetical protein